MTEEEAVQEMNALEEDFDTEEDCHIQADKILCKFLLSQGYENIVEAYRDAEERIDFYYS